MERARTPTPEKGYRIAGKGPDGIPILEPKTRPNHFTSREMTTTVETVKRQANVKARPRTSGPKTGE